MTFSIDPYTYQLTVSGNADRDTLSQIEKLLNEGDNAKNLWTNAWICMHDSDNEIVNSQANRTKANQYSLWHEVYETCLLYTSIIYINDVDPSNATVVEMRALEAHYKVEKQGGFTSLPLEAGNMGLNDRRNFISMLKKCIEDLNKLGRFDLSLLWKKSMDAYLDLTSANSKYK